MVNTIEHNDKSGRMQRIKLFIPIDITFQIFYKNMYSNDLKKKTMIRKLANFYVT